MAIYGAPGGRHCDGRHFARRSQYAPSVHSEYGKRMRVPTGWDFEVVQCAIPGRSLAARMEAIPLYTRR